MNNEKQHTHWRKFYNPNYIGAYSMPSDGSNIILTIKNVTQEMVTGEGGKKEECMVAYFHEDSKPMILNRTNCKAITQAYGTPYIEDWAGKKVEIYVAKTKVAGTEVDALRILPKEPKLPELTKGSDAWNKAVAYVKKGGDINTIKAKYTFNEKELTDAAK